MQKNLLTGLIGLIIGSMIGFWGANALNRSPATNNDLGANAALLGLNPGQSANGSNSNGGISPEVAETLAAAEREPQNFVVQMKTGDLYAQIGRFEPAIEYYKKGLAIKPDDKQAHLVIANAYFDAGQFENAGDHYAKVLELEPTNISARTDLATTYVQRAQPDFEKAIKEFEASLAVDPKHEPTLYNLGIAYQKKGDGENARKTLDKLVAANPSSELIEKLKQALLPQPPQ